MEMGLSRRIRENYRDYFVLDESKMDSGSLQNYSLLDTVQAGETTYGIYARQNQLNHPFKNLTKRRGISTIQLDMPRGFVTDLSFFTFFVFISFCCLLIVMVLGCLPCGIMRGAFCPSEFYPKSWR